VETVDVATVLVAVTNWVVVEVAVTGTVVTVVTAPGPNRKINPSWPTAQPSVEATIQTSRKSFGTTGTENTVAQVEPFQKRITDETPGVPPTAQPSVAESICSAFSF
jgi:hypothetical protein